MLHRWIEFYFARTKKFGVWFMVKGFVVMILYICIQVALHKFINFINLFYGVMNVQHNNPLVSARC